MKQNFKKLFFIILILMCLIVNSVVKAEDELDVDNDVNELEINNSNSSSDIEDVINDIINNYNPYNSNLSNYNSSNYDSSITSMDSEKRETRSVADYIIFYVVMILISSLIPFAIIYPSLKKEIKQFKIKRKENAKSKAKEKAFSKEIKEYFEQQKMLMLDTRSDEYIYEKLGENFNIEEFYKYVFKMYKDIQNAWIDRDINRVRNVLSDEMYNTYNEEIEKLKYKKQINVLKNIKFKKAGILNVIITDKDIMIRTMLYITCNECTINKKMNMEFKGNIFKKKHYVYNLVFKKTINNAENCPKCGEKIDFISSCVCPNCKNGFVKGNEDFILNNKIKKGQW